MARDDYYPADTSGVEVLLDGRLLPREFWKRYAVYREDILKAQAGEEIRYGCSGDVRIRPSTSTAAAGVKAPDSALSDFIRNASPEQKAEVYGKVMGKVAVRQQAVIDGMKENGNG